MLDWTNYIRTDKGNFTIKQLATKYSDMKTIDYQNRQYTAQIKTDRRYVKQAKNFRIVPNEEFLVQNENGDWKKLEYIYFFGSTEYVFKIHFYIPEYKKYRTYGNNDAVVPCLPRQMFLTYSGGKLTWKNLPMFEGISKEFVKVRHEHLHYAEYMGVIKNFKKSQLVSVKAEDSLGVCLESGIVALSST